MAPVLLLEWLFMRGAILALIPAALLAASSLSAQETVYQWKDANGVTHYSQTPPENVRYDSRQIRDRSLGSIAQKADAPSVRTPQEIAACDRARLALQQLNSNFLVTMDKDGDGTPEPLSAEEKAAQRRLSDQAVAAYCEPPGSAQAAVTSR